MNTTSQTAAITESKFKITTSNLIRWTGLASMVAGVIFAGIQPIHPADVVESVNTTAWAIITSAKTIMCVLLLLGIAGLYARQAKESGKLGLIGFSIFSVGWLITTAFVFAETVILPPLAAFAPKFVDGVLGVAANRPSDLDLGAIPTLFALGGIMYMLGGLMFGIAIFRAAILPRWACGLLAVTAALTPLAALLPHAIQRLAAMPMGLALACLGYALWSERRAQVSEAVSARISSQLTQTAAK